MATSRETVAGVLVSLAASQTTAAPGDTVRLTASARNTTTARIQLGAQCGPALDVVIVTPGGERRSVLTDMTGGAFFTCELRPEDLVEPGSTRTVPLIWIAPSARGQYVAQAGLRRSDGLGNLSAPLVLQVR